jgi:hypothetical protein
VGDSTRAISSHGGQYLFYEIEEALDEYNVESVLLAKAGHEAREFAEASSSPTWQDVVNATPGNGSTTIVDISLGINDMWSNASGQINENLKTAITNIQASKPNVHFILTMPNRKYNDDGFTQTLRNKYIALSEELNIPLINVVDELMPTAAETSFDWYKDDNMNVHLSLLGQHLIAELVLSKILP